LILGLQIKAKKVRNPLPPVKFLPEKELNTQQTFEFVAFASTAGGAAYLLRRCICFFGKICCAFFQFRLRRNRTKWGASEGTEGILELVTTLQSSKISSLRCRITEVEFTVVQKLNHPARAGRKKVVIFFGRPFLFLFWAKQKRKVFQNI